MKKLRIGRGLTPWLSSLFVILTMSSLSQTHQSKSNVLNEGPLLYKSQPNENGIIRCHTMEADSIRRSLNPNLPSLLQEEVWLQGKIAEYKADAAAKAANGTPKALQITLPIVFHVLTSGTGPTNVPASRVQAQVDQLNLDFANLAGSTHPDAADIQVQFCLALVDPNGNVMAEPGINRITTYGATAQSQGSMDGGIKQATIWDPNNYVNIWVANLGGGLLGYAQFPSSSGLAGLNANGGAANTDGVVILHTSLGSVASPGSSGAPYNLGRTLTHEIGHWVGLRHIWGDSNCGNDFCADTPQTQSSNGGCPTQTTCDGIQDMVQNYMDYTNDACMNIFTDDQKTRIRTVLDVCPRRMTLAASTACTLPASDDAGISAIISASGDICTTTFTPVVTLKNFGGTTMTSATITYNIDGGTNSTFNWTGSLVSTATIDVTLPDMTTTAGPHTFNASATSPNGQVDGNPANNASSSSFDVVLGAGSAVPVVEGFVGTTFVPTGWMLENGGNTLTWARVTNAGVAPTTGNAAKMDNYSTNIAGDVDGLVSMPVDLTGLSSAQITFDVAYARYSATYSDQLDVVVYGCGLPETTVYSKSGSTLATRTDLTSAFTPTAAQWRNETIDLTPYLGNNRLFIAFRNISGYGNNLYLDNINISGVTISNPPVAGFTSGGTTICAGQTVTYTNSSTNSPTSYSWSFPGGTPATSTAANPVVTYSTPGQYDVSLTATNAAGSNTSNQTNYVNVVSVPVISAGTISSPGVCGGSDGSAVINGSGTGDVSWTGTSSNSVTGVSMPYTMTGLSAGTYNVTYTTNCVSNTVVINVSDPSAPSSPVVSVVNNCGSSTLTTSGSNLEWSTGETSSSIVVTNPGNYTVTQSVGGCTSANGSATASPIAIPSAPVVTVTNNCGSSVLTTSGSNLAWSTGETSSSITVSSSGAYTVTQTVNGCTSSNGTGTASPIAIPSAPVVSVTDGCGSSVLSATGSGLSWSTGQTGSSITVTTSGAITVTQTVSGCTSAPGTGVTAPLSNPTVNLSSLPIVCVNAVPYTLVEGAPAGGTYSGTGVSGGMFDAPTAGVGTWPITYTYVDGNGCSGSAQSNMVVDACAGIEEDSFEIGLMPNPTNGSLTVTSKQTMNGYLLYDYSGRLVLQSSENPSVQFELDLSEFAEGVYHIVVQLENAIQTEKILLKK